VTGASAYVNPQNVPSLVTSSIGADHTIQDNGKIKVAYDFSPTIRATYSFNVWQNDADKTIESYLKNAAGQTVYQGNVKINGVNYLIPAPAASTQDSNYYMHGIKVKSDTGGRWDWEVNASAFNESKDEIRTSSGNTGTTPSANATAGTIAIADGTGWKNLDLRGDFRPDGDLRSTHQLSFGYHIDAYNLQTNTYNLVTGTNWKTSAQGALSTNSLGKSETQALYLQDAWQLAPAWKLVAGGRMENWQASDGSNLAASGVNVVYPDRSVNAFSPKLALFYQVSENWGLRSSYGRATRFPTVGELFANITPQSLSGGTLTTPQIAALPPPYNSPTNNPNLKPETDDSMEFTAERYFENGLWRNSLFGEYKQNAIINTTDITSLPGYLISGNTNVDEIHTVGFESVLELTNTLIRGLDFSGSATWVNSVITADAGNPGLVDTAQPRIPNFRTTLSATYHQNDRLSYTLNYRYSGRQHVALFNTTTKSYTDPNPNVYGTTVSNYSVIDTKVNYKMTRQWTLSAGVNNLANDKYYVNPNPYPQRTFYASVKFDY
jgi:iron complex outermembrane receptor protein